MTYEMKDGSFSLFKNDKKLTEKHPDYKGSIKINGVEHWFDAWLKEGKKGKFLSGRIGDPKQKGFTPKGDDEMPVKDDDEDDIPFQEIDMKKIITGVVTYMLLMSSAYACQTQTLIVGGKLQVCTICGSVVSCM